MPTINQIYNFHTLPISLSTSNKCRIIYHSKVFALCLFEYDCISLSSCIMRVPNKHIHPLINFGIFSNPSLSLLGAHIHLLIYYFFLWMFTYIVMLTRIYGNISELAKALYLKTLMEVYL